MPHATNGDVRIQWDECGAGPPLLLVMGHGFGGSGWHRMVPAFSERFRVITFDNRGVGASDVPPGPYTIPAMATDALAVLDAAGAERAHVFGISMGGLVAQCLALDHADRVERLVLGCTACAAPAGRRRPGIHVLQAWLPTRAIQRMSTPVLYSPSTSRALIDADFEILGRDRRTPRGLAAQAAAVAAYTTCDRLGEITAPTLVLHGERDKLVPVDRGEQLAERIPGARLVRLDAGHVFTTDATDAAIEAVVSFLD